MQSFRYKTALLIDDDEVDTIIHVSIIRNILLAEKTITFTSAKEALVFIHEITHFGQDLPDIIFLDINMPALNGFDFLDKLKHLPSSVWKNTKIIMLSSTLHLEEIEKINCNSLVYTFINKPLTSQALKLLLWRCRLIELINRVSIVTKLLSWP